MTYQTETIHKAVREGYRCLLKCDARLILPQDHERICAYYRRMAESCLRWAEAAEGERLREAYLALEDHLLQARFAMAQYELRCEPVWWGEGHVSYVCRSVMRTGETEIRRTMAQVWNSAEQTLLPMSRIVKQFSGKSAPRRIPFRPDGVYPTEGELVFYRNGNAAEEGAEFRVPRA